MEEGGIRLHIWRKEGAVWRVDEEKGGGKIQSREDQQQRSQETGQGSLWSVKRGAISLRENEDGQGRTALQFKPQGT